MTDFNLPDPIPEYLEHEEFCFEVLHPKHVGLDYQALMKSKDFLHRWSDSSWPEDHFKVEDNLLDLEWHFEEFKVKTAFTYTILNHDKTQCLGCIYIRPVAFIQSLSREEEVQIEPFHFFVSYWVITEIRNSQMETHIFNTLRQWMLTAWQFQGILFVSNAQIPEQNEIYRNNQMKLYLELQEKNRYQQYWIPVKG